MTEIKIPTITTQFNFIVSFNDRKTTNILRNKIFLSKLSKKRKSKYKKKSTLTCLIVGGGGGGRGLIN